MAINLGGQIAVGAANGDFRGYLAVFLVAEQVGKHVGDDDDRVGLIYVALLGRLDNRLEFFKVCRNPISGTAGNSGHTGPRSMKVMPRMGGLYIEIRYCQPLLSEVAFG